MTSHDERLEPIRTYLRRAFPGWQLSHDWNPQRDAHVFRLARAEQPIHLLTVRRQLLDIRTPEELEALLAAREIARVLREAPANRVVLNAADAMAARRQ